VSASPAGNVKRVVILVQENHTVDSYFRGLAPHGGNVTGAFLENHRAGFGTNSTANYLIIVGGQSPTLKNPPSSASPELSPPPSS
jgi:phospholipase C